MSKFVTILAISSAIVLSSVTVASAASNSAGRGTAAGTTVGPATTVNVPLTFNSAYDVFQIHATTAAAALTVSVGDCCIVGDRWIHRTYCLHNNSTWDVRGMGNGSTSTFSGNSTVFKLGPQAVDCITEIRYGQGVAIFPAGMTVKFVNSTADAITATVLAAPIPLPSK